MNKSNRTEDWPIYNCHIHTFTRKHTPKNFIRWVLADAKRGRVDLLRVPLYLILFFLYVAAVFIVGNYIAFLSAHLDGMNLPIYALLLLFESMFAMPLLVLAFVWMALIIALLLQAAVDWWANRRQQRQSKRKNGSVVPTNATKKGLAQEAQEMVQHPNILIDLLAWLNPAATNDIFERIARFLKIAAQPSQRAIFDQIRLQYPYEEPKIRTRFVVLPMDMTHMELGDVEESIHCQHLQLLKLTRLYRDQIIPFYAADPRQEDVVEQVRRHVKYGQFRGVKIYPNLGYRPCSKKLMKIYEICVGDSIPVMTHCSPGGIWKYGLSETERRAFSQPESYLPVFKEFKDLKLCLAHFGGAEEWARQLNRTGRHDKYAERPWVKTIYEMIAHGEKECPNLYTDISYTAFTPRLRGLYIDLVDYLKVLLSNDRVRTHVLFGSDYYMVEREQMSEKEASVLLRSRLGEDLYKQIAHTNPMEFLRRAPKTRPSIKMKNSIHERSAIR